MRHTSNWPTSPDALLQRIEWTVIRRLDGLFQGDYHSLFRGTGIDLADLREYQPSDDVRAIDWNVTARLQTPYVREFLEDRELTAWFLVDLTPSVAVSWSTTRKETVVVEFVTLLARLLTRRGNRVGALLYYGPAMRRIPAGGSREHVLFLANLLLRHRTESAFEPTDLGRAIRKLLSATNRRSLVFVISDFISAPGWDLALGELSRRHEVVAIRVLDPTERELPDLGIAAIEDAETGEQIVVDTSSRRFRRAFTEAAAEQDQRIRTGFANAGVDALELVTTDDLIQSVLRFSELRRIRRTASR